MQRLTVVLLLFAAVGAGGCRAVASRAPHTAASLPADDAPSSAHRQDLPVRVASHSLSSDDWSQPQCNPFALPDTAIRSPRSIVACSAAHGCDGCVLQPESAAVDYRFADDIRDLGPMLWRDAAGIIEPDNLVILGVSLGAAIGIRQDLDSDVRQETLDNPLRWGDLSRVLGYLGEAPYQVPVLGAMWGVSVWTDDPELHRLTRTMVSAYTISGLSTLAIKAATDTDRPDDDWNDGRWGFPSFHAASAFTIAGVLEEYYGWDVGLPAYTLAGLISWSRIDERDHDLSDVVFGAAMGWVIGKSVAGQHLRGDGRVRVMPWVHPTDSAAGLMFDTRF